METKKSPKAELVAIYRLEFYKKQKSWKLCTDARNHKSDKTEKIKKPLNETYDVEDPKTEACQLNDAFFDTDSDNSLSASNPQPACSNTSSQQKTLVHDIHNAFNAWQEKEQGKEQILQSIQNEFLPPEKKYSVTATEDNLNYYDAKVDNMEFNYCSSRINPHDDYDINENWSQRTDVERIWPIDEAHNMNRQSCGDNTANTSSKADNWLRGDETTWLPDDGDIRWMSENAYSYGEGDWDVRSENSVDSLGEFMRGADAVPHSSELDLQIHNGLTDADLNANSLACLSTAQLTAAVSIHTRALRRLLREESQRRRIRSCLSLANWTTDRHEITPRAAMAYSSCDEYPTRDIDPCHLYYKTGNTLIREKTFTKCEFKDVFVAGSYRNLDLEPLSRGRGRLQNATMSDASKRIIGMGRGRPFRL